MFAFEFSAFDGVANPELEKWDRKIRSVNVIVMAENETEALAKAQGVTSRENFNLSSIVEVSAEFRAVAPF